MKIKIGSEEPLVISISCGKVELEELYNGVGINTDQGYFGIAQRDSGIEVVLDGELVWSSTSVIPHKNISTKSIGRVDSEWYAYLNEFNSDVEIRELFNVCLDTILSIDEELRVWNLAENRFLTQDEINYIRTKLEED